LPNTKKDFDPADLGAFATPVSLRRDCNFNCGIRDESKTEDEAGGMNETVCHGSPTENAGYSK
jgi:hypothetical protein